MQSLTRKADNVQTLPQLEPQSGMAPMVSAILAQGDPSVETLEKLLVLNERWEASEARKAYHQAMADARSVMGSARRGSKNTHLHTTYASLDDLIEAARPPLSAHGLSFSWDLKQTDSTVTAECKITHAMGHTESTSVTMPVGAPIKSNSGKQVTSSAQTVGIAITYAKRYSFSALVGIATEDNDGHMQAAAPVIEICDESDFADIRAVCDEVGKDYAQWVEWKSEKIQMIDGVLQLAKSQKGVAIAQIKRPAK